MATLSNERITTRVNQETRELLEKALSLSGYASLNSFIAQAAVSEAKRLIEQSLRVELCQKDALAFIDALENPAKPNDRLLRAARQHKETIDNEGREFR